MAPAESSFQKSQWLFVAIVILVLLGAGLLFLNKPGSVTLQDTPSVEPTGAVANSETDLGSFDLLGTQVRQTAETVQGVRKESFHFSDAEERTYLVYVPKSLATKASFVQIEGQVTDVQVLVDDPIVSFVSRSSDFAFFVQPDPDAQGNVPKKIFLFAIPKSAGVTQDDLKKIADKLSKLPDYAFADNAFPELRKQITTVFSSKDAQKGMDALLIQYGAQSPVSPSESQPTAELQSLLRANEPRRFNLASPQDEGREEFYVSATQGGALLPFRLLLPFPLDEIKYGPEFRLDPESAKLVEPLTRDSISATKKVDGLDGYAHDFNVLLKLKPSDIQGGAFPDMTVTGTLYAPLIPGEFIPSSYAASVTETTGQGEPLLDAEKRQSKSTSLSIKHVKVTIHFQKSIPFIQAGYFWPGNARLFQTKPSAVFLTNDYPGGALEVQVCGKSVKIPAQSGFVVPLKPARAIAIAFDDALSDTASGTLLFDYVFPSGDSAASRQIEIKTVDAQGKETAFKTLGASDLKEVSGQFTLKAPKEGRYRMYASTQVSGKKITNSQPHTFNVYRIYVTKNAEWGVDDVSGFQTCDIKQGGKLAQTVVLSDPQNFVPGTLSYVTSYNKDLFCPGLKTTLANAVLAYGDTLKTIDPLLYTALWGKTFTQTMILRTSAGIADCKLDEPFDKIGTADAPKTLADYRAYVMKIDSNLDEFPQARPHMNLETLNAQDATTAKIFNTPNWQASLLSSSVKS